MRILAVLTLLPLLAGCTDADWNRMLSFNDSGRPRPATVATAAPRPAAPASVATAAPAPTTPASAAPGSITQAEAAAQLNPLCLGVARQDAMTNDFDVPTQQKVATRAYTQCQAIFGN